MRLSSLFLIFLVFSLFSFDTYAQKTIDKHIDAHEIKSIHIDSDMIFRINVITAKTDQIHLKSEIFGETFETMLLHTELKNGALLITTGRSAYYHDMDDKLAAHKVMSIELSMEIPEEGELWIASELASVVLHGSCNYINFNLSSGDCRLVSFRGSGTVNTKKGNITIENPACTMDAESRNGSVTAIKNSLGSCKLMLRSIDGDIAAVSSN